MSAIKNATRVLILLFIAFSSGGGCTQSDDAQGGYILIIDLDVSSSTDYWLGYYGSVIPASENPHYLDNRTRIQEINISWMGGCLLITDSQIIPNLGHLSAGNPALIDAIIGTGYDSGSMTFTATENYRIYDQVLPAPTAFIFVNCSESTCFREGFFTEQGKDNLVFIAPVVENGTCYNAMPCNFQFILPNDPASPMTYQMYHIPTIPPVTEPSAISLTAYPGIIEADGTENSTITTIVIDKSGRMVKWTEVTFATTLGEITPQITAAENGTTTAILTSSTSPGTAVVKGAIATMTSVYDIVYVPFIRTAGSGCNGTLGTVTVTVLGRGISMADTAVTIKDGVITVDTTEENVSIIAGNATAGMVISIPIKGGSLEITLEDDAIAVADTVIGDISKIRLNTPPEEYITSKTDVGTASVDLDVDFQGTVTPCRDLSFKTTLLERYSDLEYLNVSDPYRLKETLAAYFGADTSAIADNTPILVYAELSATNLTSSELIGVPISITLNKTWFDTVAGGEPDNVVLFKINETTGELEGNITMTPESIDITGDRVTFRATFDHFSVFAIVARPAAIHPGGGGDGTYPPVNVTPTITPASAPVETTVVAAGTPTPTVASAWETPEEQPGREEWSYLIWALLLAIAAGIFIIVLWRSRSAPAIIIAKAGCDGTLENATVTVLRTGISVADTTVAIEDGVITINTTEENAIRIADNATAGTVISVPIKGGTLEITLEDDATAVSDTVSGNVSKIRLNTPPEEHITSKPDIGTVSAGLDVEFQGTFTPCRRLFLKTALVERYEDLEDLNVSDPCRLKEALAAYFSADTSAIAANTPILAYAELSATGINRSDVIGVPISITLHKDWFDTVAGGNPGNVVLFKINETTGELDGDITMTPESATITGDRVTFRATFDHFSVFAIVARPPAAIHPHSRGDDRCSSGGADTNANGSSGMGDTGGKTGARRMVVSHLDNPARHRCWHPPNRYIAEITQ